MQPPAPRYLLHILTASAGNSGVDVAYRVRDACEGKPACSFVGDAKFLHGDPAPREKGHFSIKYACTTGFQSQDARHDVFGKNATILLNCQPRMALDGVARHGFAPYSPRPLAKARANTPGGPAAKCRSVAQPG